MVLLPHGLSFLAFVSVLELGQCFPQITPAPTLPPSSLAQVSSSALPPRNSTAIASATVAAQALSSAVAAYKVTPDKGHADAAKKAADDAKAAAAVVGAISPGFAALIANLESVGTAAEAAVANPGPETATQLDGAEKKAEDAEEDIEEEQKSQSGQPTSGDSSQVPSSSTSTSSTMTPIPGPPLQVEFQQPMAQSDIDSIESSMLQGDRRLGCVTTEAFPFPTACPKPNCKENKDVNSDPNQWCTCDDKGPFAAISGKTDGFCDFDVMPTSTITITPVKPPTRPFCGNYGLSWGTDNKPKTFTQSEAFDAIDKICNFQGNAPEWPLAASAAPDSRAGSRFWYSDTGTFCMGVSPGYWPSGDCPHSYDKWISIFFRWSSDQNGCAAKSDWKLPRGDACRDPLRRLVQDCDINTQTEKWGATWRLKTEQGCIDLTLFGVYARQWHDATTYPDGQPNADHEITM